MLEKIRKQLHELKEKLQAQRKNIRVKIVETYIRVIEKLMEKLKDNKLDNTKFNEFIKRVKSLLEDFAEKQRSISMWSGDDENLLDLDDEELLVSTEQSVETDDDEQVLEPEDNEEEEEQKVLEPEDLDKEEEQKEEEDEKVDDNDLPNENQTEDNLSALEKVRKQLHELRNRLQQQRRSIRARIVDGYLVVVDALIERLKNHKLDNTRLNSFLLRAKKLLEDYASSLRS